MPVPASSDEIACLGKKALDAHIRNMQIGNGRPFYKKLLKRKRTFSVVGSQCIVENVRSNYDSNYQNYSGSDAVKFKKKDTRNNKVYYKWMSTFDGFSLHEDDLLSAGIIIKDNAKNQLTALEKDRLNDLFKEKITTPLMGFYEQHDYNLHLDGLQNINAIPGLDALISLTPSTGTIGGVNAAHKSYWRNQVATSIAAAKLIETMEKVWRKCMRTGGAPSFILAGSNMIDTFRKQAKDEIARYTIVQVSGQPVDFDPSVTDLHFHRVPIIWDPVFADLDSATSPATLFENRMYFINCDHLTYYTGEGYDMKLRGPMREHDGWVIATKFSLTMNQRNCHAVLAL